MTTRSQQSSSSWQVAIRLSVYKAALAPARRLPFRYSDKPPKARDTKFVASRQQLAPRTNFQKAVFRLRPFKGSYVDEKKHPSITTDSSCWKKAHSPAPRIYILSLRGLRRRTRFYWSVISNSTKQSKLAVHSSSFKGMEWKQRSSTRSSGSGTRNFAK